MRCALAKEDRNVLRFLWVSDIDYSVIMFRIFQGVFGVSCSPFLLNATLRYRFETYAEANKNLARKLRNGFYGDDLVSGDQNNGAAIELYRK